MVERKDLIRMTPTDAEIEQAIAEAKAFRHSDSSMENTRNWVGQLGEIVAARLLNARRVTERPQCYDFDLVLADGRTVDVKAKRKTVDPQMLHDASVQYDRGYGPNQKCELYLWVFVVCRYRLGDPEYVEEPETVEQAAVISAWLLGYMEREEFLGKARFTPRGTKREGFGVAKENQFDVPVATLYPIGNLPRTSQPPPPNGGPWPLHEQPDADRCDEPARGSDKDLPAPYWEDL